MKKIIILSALTLSMGIAGFANGSSHVVKKVSKPKKHQQKPKQAFMDCYLNFDTSETCCDGATVISGTGTITYDCLSGQVISGWYFYDPNGCWYNCI